MLETKEKVFKEMAKQRPEAKSATKHEHDVPAVKFSCTTSCCSFCTYL
jgi:hypothetical protein